VRILLVDDDRELCGMLTEYLAQEGFSVSSVHDGTEAQAALDADAYALVILDVMLPGRSGLDLLKQFRLRHNVPILMLTARGEDVDRVIGLELGADDYLAKPCNVRELVARVRAILRRVDGTTHARGTGLTVAQLTLDRRMQTVSCRNAPLTLTGAEYRILEILMAQAGEVVSRERLMNDALGRRLLPWDRSIDTHVSNLRRKLSAVGAGVRIVSARGSGYQLLG
jgi:DNA-binding response OmpR family regulator